MALNPSGWGYGSEFLFLEAAAIPSLFVFWRTVGENQVVVRYQIIHFPTNCVNEQVNERVQRSTQRKWAGWSNGISVVQTNKQTDEWMAHYLRPNSWLIWTTVQGQGTGDKNTFVLSGEQRIILEAGMSVRNTLGAVLAKWPMLGVCVLVFFCLREFFNG